MNVKECMNKTVYTCNPDNTIADVAKLMKDKHVGCVPVCSGQNELVGLVTDRDIILRGVACNKDANITPISEIMTTGVHWCEGYRDVSEATNMISKYQVKRIPIVDETRIIGILTLGDIANENNINNKEFGQTAQDICNFTNNAQNAE